MKKTCQWILHRLRHKFSHFSPSRLLDTLKEHGTVLVVIIVGWEIIEDILFPWLFIWLGNNVNPWFITGAPISWLLCLHPIAVPVLWGAWIKISRRKDESN
jgi:hypothetical protein